MLQQHSDAQHAASFRSWTWCRLTFCCCAGDKSATTYLTIHSGLYVRANFHWMSLWINITVRTCKQWGNSKTILQIGNSLTAWTRLLIYNSVIYVNSLLQLFLQHFLLLTLQIGACVCICAVYVCEQWSTVFPSWINPGQCLRGLQVNVAYFKRLFLHGRSVSEAHLHTDAFWDKDESQQWKKPPDVVYASVCFAFYSISSSLSAHFLRLPV